MKKIFYALVNFLSRTNLAGRNRLSLLNDPTIQFAFFMVVMRLFA